MDTVVLEEGATLGPHCVALPAARIGAGATVGPASLVMRGDEVPPSTRWQGNPIAPWNPVPQEARQTRRTRRPRSRRQRDAQARQAAKKSGPPVIDPYLPRQRQLRLPGVALRTRPRVQGRDQPAGRDRRRSPPSRWRRCSTFTLDLSDCAHGDQGDGQRHAARRISHRRHGKLHIALARPLPAGAAMTIEVRYGGTPRPIRILLGRSRFRGADRRRAGRRSAQRRRVVVPLRRPSQRQGQLPHPDQHREPVPRARQRRAGVAPGPGGA